MINIKEINQETMINADALANAVLKNGMGKIVDWVDSYSNINFNQPFFRTTTGKNTYFVIDSEILDKKISRIKSLKILLNFWADWKEKNSDKIFFWKVSGVGIHGIQQVNRSINPLRFELVFKKIFSKELGWSQYRKYLFKIINYNNDEYKVAIDLAMIGYPKLIRWVYSPYWKIKDEEYFSIPIKNWEIDIVLKNSIKSNINYEEYIIPTFQFDHLLSPNMKSTQPGFKNRYWKTRYELKIPNLNEKLSPIFLDSMKNIQEIITQAPYCIKKAVQHIKKYKKDHYKRIIVLKYLQNNGIKLENIATYFRFYLNSNMHNKELWKISYYCSYYYNKKNKLDRINQHLLCKYFNDLNDKYYILNKTKCKKINCKYLDK